MQVTWIEANIFVEPGRQDEVLLGFLRPLIQRLRTEYDIGSFHFFREPNNEIRFRVLADAEKAILIRALIDEAKGLSQVRELKYAERPCEGEETAFGEDGWKTAFRFFEASSEIALDLIDSTVNKGSQFNHIAFFHYLLNPAGFNQWAEVNIHATAIVERMLMIQMGTEQKINNLESQIGALEERIESLEKRNPAQKEGL